MTADELPQHPEFSLDTMQDIVEIYGNPPLSSPIWPFILLAILGVALFVAGLFFLQRRKKREKPIAPKDPATRFREQLNAMQEKLSDTAIAFYEHARPALNFFILARYKTNIETLSDVELEKWIAKDSGMDPAAGEKLIAVLARHTAAVFGGVEISGDIRMGDLALLQSEGRVLNPPLHEKTAR